MHVSIWDVLPPTGELDWVSLRTNHQLGSTNASDGGRSVHACETEKEDTVLRISEHCYAMFGFEDLVNAGFVVGASGVLIVDTCLTSWSAQSMKGYSQVVAPHVPARDYVVLNTHWHADHHFGNSEFAKDGATVIADEYTASIIRARTDYPAQMLKMMGNVYNRQYLLETQVVPPSRQFADRTEIDIGGVRIVLMQLGGHTLGDSVAWIPDDQVLFCGDLLYEKMPPNLKFTGDTLTWSRSLRTLQGLKPRTVVPGHGPLAGPESLHRQASFLDGLTERLAKVRSSGITDLDTIAQTLGLSKGSVEKLLERLH